MTATTMTMMTVLLQRQNLHPVVTEPKTETHDTQSKPKHGNGSGHTDDAKTEQPETRDHETPRGNRSSGPAWRSGSGATGTTSNRKWPRRR